MHKILFCQSNNKETEYHKHAEDKNATSKANKVQAQTSKLQTKNQ